VAGEEAIVCNHVLEQHGGDMLARRLK